MKTYLSIIITITILFKFAIGIFPIQVNDEELLFRNETNEILSSFAVSYDGKYIAVGDDRGDIILFDCKKKEVLRRIRAHSGPIFSIVFKPNSYEFVSCSIWDYKVKAWNLNSDRGIDIDLFNHSARCVIYSPDGRKIFAASNPDNPEQNADLKIWNGETKSLERSITVESGIRDMKFNKDGSKLYCGTSNGKILVLDGKRGELLETLALNLSPIRSISINSEGNILACGATDERYLITLLDLNNGLVIGTLTDVRTAGKVYSIAFSKDGNFLLSAGQDRRIHLWNVKNGELVRSVDLHNGSINQIILSTDGDFLYSCSEDRRLKSLYWKPRKIVLGRHESDVNDMAFNNSGNLLATVSNDNKIKIWNLENNREYESYSFHDNWIKSVSFHPEGKLIASASMDKTVKIINIEEDKVIKTLKSEEWINSVKFSPDGKYLAAGGLENVILIWDVDNDFRQERRRLAGHLGAIYSIDFNPDGRYLISAGQDEKIVVWDFEERKIEKEKEGHSGSIYSVKFSPNGDLIASASKDNTIKLWDGKTFEIKRTLIGHKYPVYSLSFTTDGKYLFSGGEDGKIQVWDLHTGEIFKTLSEESFSLNALSFSPTNNYVAYGGSSKEVILHDIAFLMKEEEITEEIVEKPPEIEYVIDDKSPRVEFTSTRGIEVVGVSTEETGTVIETYNDVFIINGIASDNTGIKYISINGINIESENLSNVNADEYASMNLEPVAVSFHEKQNLNIGKNKFNVYAEDHYGNRSDKKVLEIIRKEKAEPEIAITKEPQTYAVIIGINLYENSELNLDYSRADAEFFYSFLKSKNGGSVPDENIKLLYDYDATKPKIERAFEEFLEMKPKENDKVLIYYAGHGILLDEACFVPHDFDVKFKNSSALPMNGIEKYLRNSSANEILIFVDACHGGGMTNFDASKLHTVKDGIVVFSACNPDQVSIEDKIAGHGVFTLFIKKGLEGEADKDNNLIIDDSDLGSYIFNEVPRYVEKNWGVKQNPRVYSNKIRDIILSDLR